MEDIRSILDRYPQRELDIRRLATRNPEFRSVCGDYQQTAKALRYWQKMASESRSRVEDYTGFLGELEAEILTRLNHSIANAVSVHNEPDNE